MLMPRRRLNSELRCSHPQASCRSWEKGRAAYRRFPRLAVKYDIGFRYTFAKSSSSITSTRRSPDSHFETKDCGLPNAAAAWAWVSPA